VVVAIVTVYVVVDVPATGLNVGVATGAEANVYVADAARLWDPAVLGGSFYLRKLLRRIRHKRD